MANTEYVRLVEKDDQAIPIQRAGRRASRERFQRGCASWPSCPEGLVSKVREHSRKGSPNNSRQRTALRAAADAERWAAEG